MKDSEKESRTYMKVQYYSERELIPLINSEDTKITVITIIIIHNREIPITKFSLKPKSAPNSLIIIPEPFQNECPSIAINTPQNNDLGGIILNLETLCKSFDFFLIVKLLSLDEK